MNSIQSNLEDLKNMALNYSKSGRNEEALQQWKEVITLYPGYTPGYLDAIDILVVQKKFAEAEKLCRLGLKKCYSQISDLKIAYACIKNLVADYSEAFAHWLTSREDKPTDPSGYCRAAAACRALRYFQQADELCEKGMLASYEAVESFSNYAENALAKGDFAAALERWALVRAKFPTYPAGYSRVAFACRALKDYQQADELCEQGMLAAPEAAEIFSEYAENALARGKYAVALERWAVVRTKFPKYPAGYSRAAAACRALKKYKMADELCEQGMLAAPEAVDIFSSYAENSMSRGDFAAALERWAVVRDKFPKCPDGYSRAATACRVLKDNRQADELCVQGMSAVPEAIENYSNYAENAMAKGEYAEALPRWVVVRKKFPKNHIGYTRAAIACRILKDYRQADELCEQGMSAVPGAFENYSNYAENAMARGEYAEALQRWAVVRSKFPKHPAGYTRAAAACRALKDYQQADKLCEQGMSAVPALVDCFSNYAENSMAKGDYAEALQRWTLVRKKFPKRHVGYTRAAAACRILKDYQQADKLCEQGMSAMPGAIENYSSYAENCMAKGEYAEALQRWAVVRNKFPKHHPGYSRAAVACRILKDYQQADELCEQGMLAAPASVESFNNYAENCMARNELREALKRWEVVMKKFPRYYLGYSRAAVAATRLKQFKYAEELCFQGIKNTDHPDHYINYAKIPMSYSGFREALKRWHAAYEKYPFNTVICSGYATAAMKIMKFDLAESICRQSMKKADSSDIRIKYAEIAMDRMDFSEALRRWEDVIQLYPDNPLGYSSAVDACRELGLFEQAQKICKQGLEQACNIRLFNQMVDILEINNHTDNIKLYKDIINIKKCEYKKYNLVASLVFISNIYFKLIQEYRKKYNLTNNIIKRLYYKRIIDKYENEYNKISNDIKDRYRNKTEIIMRGGGKQ